MDFDQWYAKAYPMSQDMQNAEHHRMKRVAAAAWNDSRQLALAAVFLKYHAMRKQLLTGTLTENTRRVLGEFLIELSEMT